MTNKQPGTPELRKLLLPYIEAGEYPEMREMRGPEVDFLHSQPENLVYRFSELISRYSSVGDGEYPTPGSPLARLREEICSVLRELIVTAPSLIGMDPIQPWAIVSGAIPDPATEMNYYRLPYKAYAHWECGTRILAAPLSLPRYFLHEDRSRRSTRRVRSLLVPYCPTCEKAPTISSHHPLHTGAG